jgi:hypothetical protein
LQLAVNLPDQLFAFFLIRLPTMASAALAMIQEPRRIDRAEAEPPPACTRSVSPVTSLTR